ncbi:hypothetical protein CPB85DRAFT_1432119 [Mucidula mucida]|nr:hypothetical protein CPB85DRAFT_1432119 [Mucidula mucida]
MAALTFAEHYKAPQFYDRISEVQDDLLFYDTLALPIVPQAFDIIVITECLHATKNSSVYSGYFVDREGKRYEEYDVAFKFGDDEQLCQEANKYEKMFRLQGKAIPRLIGLAFADRARGGYMGCLMTEKFGSALDCDLISLARSDKAIILNHLQSIHDRGLIHADFKESNVLQRGSEYRLVDFDHMRETHRCTATGKAVDFREQPDTLSIEAWDVICASVRGLGMAMDFWDDGTVFVNGYTWKKEGLPSARIMELLFPDILKDKYDGTKELPEILQLYFKHIQTLLDSGTHSLERLRDNIDQIAAQVEKQWLRSQKKRPASAEPLARAVRARITKPNRRAPRKEGR